MSSSRSTGLRKAPARPSPSRPQSAFYTGNNETSVPRRPTVIKPPEGSGASHRLKKRPPPRPPPPKSGSCSTPGSRGFAPPSYDEVMRSEPHVNAYVNSAFPSWDESPTTIASRNNNRNPPPIKRPLSRIAGRSNVIATTRKPSDDLLELSDIFNNLQGGSDNMENKRNLGPRVLPADPWTTPALKPHPQNGHQVKPSSGVSGHPWPPPAGTTQSDGDSWNNNKSSAAPQPKASDWTAPPPQQSRANDWTATFEANMRGSSVAKPSVIAAKPMVSAKPSNLGKTALPPRPGSVVADVPAQARPLSNITPSGPYCVAEFDYTANQSDELTFRAADTITLLSRVNAEWLKGKIGVREGIFPENFVKIEVPLLSDGTPHTLVGSQCRALYDFKPSSDGDLPLRQGDMVTIDEQIDSEWVRGTAASGRTGVFPLSFVEVFGNFTNITDDWKEECTQRGADEVSSPVVSKTNFKYDEAIGEYLVLYDFEAQSSEELGLRQGQRVFVTGASGADWLTGYVVGGTDLKDKIFPKSFVTKIEDDGSAKVLYDFEPTSADELKCMAGESVTIVKEVSKEWLLVEKNGVSGMVPSTFVQIL